ncbi:MAG: phenylalanine--tRNA ligase subunit beta [Bryobacteraceae bacterium]|nr:phenylalanine--tRNA ligase subunit beta [Bryobacteraceae bacterium]
MRFSYNWIQELVPSLKATPEETMRQITLRTAEAEGLEPVGQHFWKVVSAKVVDVQPIEGSHNQRVVVKSAQYGTRTVVCGAPNVRPGMVAVYCPTGVEIDGKRLTKATISGVESDGMLASGKELGINRDHEGIVEVGGGIGCTPDFIIEIDNKSLTHRPDLWGHYGMAREVSAIFGLDLKDPVKLRPFPEELACIDVAIRDFTLCPRYSALIFENVRVGPSPLWFQYRLESLGLNPINNIVDVTNYIMAELAQPMHAFDADKLQGGIRVRNAHESEQIAALNGEIYSLDSATLVITDDTGPIAIAGVIGGADSAISAGTTRIVLESANFQAASVRKTSTRLKLRTDASMRFEKSQDPANTVRALARAVALLQQVCPGIRVKGGLSDVHAELRHPAPIRLPLDWLGRKLGNAISAATATKILTRLQFGVSEIDENELEVRVPSWRATKDISLKEIWWKRSAA